MVQKGARWLENEPKMAPGWSKMTSIIAPRGFKSKIKKQVPNLSVKRSDHLDISGPNLGPKWSQNPSKIELFRRPKNKSNIRGSWDRFLIDFWTILGGLLEPCWRRNGAQDGSYLENTLYQNNPQKQMDFNDFWSSRSQSWRQESIKKTS